jgi:hypothetical protein
MMKSASVIAFVALSANIASAAEPPRRLVRGGAPSLRQARADFDWRAEDVPAGAVWNGGAAAAVALYNDVACKVAGQTVPCRVPSLAVWADEPNAATALGVNPSNAARDWYFFPIPPDEIEQQLDTAASTTGLRPEQVVGRIDAAWPTGSALVKTEKSLWLVTVIPDGGTGLLPAEKPDPRVPGEVGSARFAWLWGRAAFLGRLAAFKFDLSSGEWGKPIVGPMAWAVPPTANLRGGSATVHFLAPAASDQPRCADECSSVAQVVSLANIHGDSAFFETPKELTTSSTFALAIKADLAEQQCLSLTSAVPRSVSDPTDFLRVGTISGCRDSSSDPYETVASNWSEPARIYLNAGTAQNAASEAPLVAYWTSQIGMADGTGTKFRHHACFVPERDGDMNDDLEHGRNVGCVVPTLDRGGPTGAITCGPGLELCPASRAKVSSALAPRAGVRGYQQLWFEHALMYEEVDLVALALKRANLLELEPGFRSGGAAGFAAGVRTGEPALAVYDKPTHGTVALAVADAVLTPQLGSITGPTDTSSYAVKYTPHRLQSTANELEVESAVNFGQKVFPTCVELLDLERAEVVMGTERRFPGTTFPNVISALFRQEISLSVDLTSSQRRATLTTGPSTDSTFPGFNISFDTRTAGGDRFPGVTDNDASTNPALFGSFASQIDSCPVGTTVGLANLSLDGVTFGGTSIRPAICEDTAVREFRPANTAGSVICSTLPPALAARFWAIANTLANLPSVPLGRGTCSFRSVQLSLANPQVSPVYIKELHQGGIQTSIAVSHLRGKVACVIPPPPPPSGAEAGPTATFVVDIREDPGNWSARLNTVALADLTYRDSVDDPALSQAIATLLGGTGGPNGAAAIADRAAVEHESAAYFRSSTVNSLAGVAAQTGSTGLVFRWLSATPVNSALFQGWLPFPFLNQVQNPLADTGPLGLLVEEHSVRALARGLTLPYLTDQCFEPFAAVPASRVDGDRCRHSIVVDGWRLSERAAAGFGACPSGLTAPEPPACAPFETHFSLKEGVDGAAHLIVR